MSDRNWKIEEAQWRLEELLFSRA